MLKNAINITHSHSTENVREHSCSECSPYSSSTHTITSTHAPSALRRTLVLGCVCRADCQTPGEREHIALHLVRIFNAHVFTDLSQSVKLMNFVSGLANICVQLIN